jgi:hypothetical protein
LRDFHGRYCGLRRCHGVSVSSPDSWAIATDFDDSSQLVGYIRLQVKVGPQLWRRVTARSIQ